MSTEIKVGDRRIFRSTSAREIEIIEQLTEDPFAGEFRYRYTDDLGGSGILTAENLEMSTRPVPADHPTDAPQDHGPLAAPLSDRTLAKVLSRPAYVPRGTEPEPFSVEGMVITSGWLAEQVGECTCGGVDQYGHECHEPGCGLEPVARLDDLPGWPRTSRPTTDEAVAAIKKRLSWASIHWGTEGVSEDAWPHIADAVLSLWDAEGNR